ncbi:MAG: type I-E CRISPR-associated protein Cse1/CasA [Acidobacteria bacterium]|nr:type I-E CRISPR-associated protein Cse1/CasA [Acidobacteriota bacterium]
MAKLNLITDAWIPVRCRSGRRVIRPDQIAEPDVLRPDWPRPDLNLACLEFLAGLVYLAHPPRGSDDRENPPKAGVLRAAMAPLAPAFELLGDGPRFLQDFEPIDGREWPSEQLFIDSARDETVRNNQDVMVRRGRYRGLRLPLAAMALYTLQAFAPSGGRGHFTSLRGGGPMVCLVRPDGAGLLSLIWANVPLGEPLIPSELEALPWMKPTRASRVAGGHAPESFPESDSPSRPDPEVFFGQPRRIRLVVRDGCVTHFFQSTYGAKYPPERWHHPLTPYYAKGAELHPVHPEPGNFSYRHWRGVVLQSDSGRQPSALVQYLKDVEYGDCSLIVGGWAIAKGKATPLDFVWSEQPVFRLPSKEVEDSASAAVEAADLASRELARRVSLALGEGSRRKTAGRKVGNIAAGGGLRVRERLFVHTQIAFEGVLDGMSAGRAFAPEKWAGVIRQAALAIFDAEVTPGLADLSEARRTAAIKARRQLLAALAGRGAAGKRIFAALRLQPTPARHNGGRAE